MTKYTNHPPPCPPPPYDLFFFSVCMENPLPLFPDQMAGPPLSSLLSLNWSCCPPPPHSPSHSTLIVVASTLSEEPWIPSGVGDASVSGGGNVSSLSCSAFCCVAQSGTLSAACNAWSGACATCGAISTWSAKANGT